MNWQERIETKREAGFNAKAQRHFLDRAVEVVGNFFPTTSVALRFPGGTDLFYPASSHHFGDLRQQQGRHGRALGYAVLMVVLVRLATIPPSPGTAELQFGTRRGCPAEPRPDFALAWLSPSCFAYYGATSRRASSRERSPFAQAAFPEETGIGDPHHYHS